jgi:hypothetical protein
VALANSTSVADTNQQPIPLATLETTTVVLTPEGVLRCQMGAYPVNRYGIDTLARAALCGDMGLFSRVADPLLLAHTVERLTQLFFEYLQTPSDEGEAFRHRLGRAAILALIRSAARQAEVIGATMTRDVMLARLLDCITREALLGMPAAAAAR